MKLDYDLCGRFLRVREKGDLQRSCWIMVYMARRNKNGGNNGDRNR